MSITELTPLARGGMAELHLARMTGVAGVETTVVVKRILPELLERTDFVELFISEARVAATLQHPNIVQTHQVGEDHDGYYIVMEYLQGADLRQVIRHLRQGRAGFPLELALQITIGMLGGLHYAHERSHPDGTPMGIVHRDVSPHNTFVTWDGAVKLLDFGVAKASSNLASDGELVQGKLRYMSPEQCLNATIDARSDVYSAGVMLYEMLTGQRAHPGRDRAAIQRHLLDEPVARPASHGVHLPEDLERVLMRAVRKRRGERFQTAREFQMALEDFCQANGIFPSASRLGDWVREVVPRPQTDAPNRTATITKERLTEQPLRSTTHADLRRVADITIVRVHGRLNEAFDGRAIGDQLDGTVVLDLAGVERITSFGIRSWLDMLRVSRARPLYFARVPETFTNQVTMVRGLLGKGRVASFLVPVEDDEPRTVELSGPAGRAFLVDGTLEDAVLDDDLEVYQVLEEAFDPEPPANIAGALRDLDSVEELPAIEKRLDADRTTVVLRRALGGGMRWRRLLDGLEGHVLFDLTAVTDVSAVAAEEFTRALCRIEPDLGSLAFRAPPKPLWNALLTEPALARKASLESLKVVARCQTPECGDHDLPRPVVALAEADGTMVLPSCPTCSGPMRSEALQELLPPTESTPDPSTTGRSGCIGQLFSWFR
jgi:serine/threonine protein kinase